MSDQSIIALAAVGVSGIIGLAGLGFSIWNIRRERHLRFEERRFDHKEWYRQTLFNKRLQAAQDAYSWWRRLHEAVTRAFNSDPQSEECQSVREIAAQAREWYDSNSLYLEGEATRISHFVDLTNGAGIWTRGADIEIQASLNEVYSLVQNLSKRLLAAEKTSAEQSAYD